jgi:dephospho-CoA kinase
MPRVIAVTGGIGSGKSVVCSMLRRMGYAVVDADDFAREAILLPTVRKQLEAIFGQNSYTSEGNLNKTFVRNAIFDDASLRVRMEAVVHPVVQRIAKERVRELAARSKKGWVFYEFALLFETKREADFDAVLLVTAPESVRVSRVSESRSLSQEQVGQIIAAQTTDESRLLGAHVVVENSGTLPSLERALEGAILQIEAKFSESNF